MGLDVHAMALDQDSCNIHFQAGMILMRTPSIVNSSSSSSVIIQASLTLQYVVAFSNPFISLFRVSGSVSVQLTCTGKAIPPSG